MAWHRTILTGGLTVFLMMLLARPHETAAATPPLLVQETETQLVAAGCERVELKDNKALMATESLDWQAVVPADATGEALVFCPEATRQSLRAANGRVAGWINEAQAEAQAESLQERLDRSREENEGWTWAVNLLTKLLSVLFRIIAAVGVYFLNKAVNLLPLLLTQSNFVNSGLVRDIWPIVLGITNGGFLLALVLIALLTVLRLDVGGGVRRLLPRLLIAALLINFSLVIAGLILDASRVVMAMTVPLMGLSSIDDLPVKIIDIASNWKFNLELDITKIEEVGEVGTVGEENASALAELSETASNDVNLAIRGLVQAVVVWVALGAVLVVIVGLLVRYVTLIFLLILSPAAYLFMAFPGTVDLARKWWSTFLRYVVYGPIVLAFLILAVKSAEKLTELYRDINLLDDPALKQAFILAVFCTFLVLGAVAGRYAGILGAAAAISVATGAGRRVRGMAYRGVTGTGKAAAKGVYVGTGARRGLREARDYFGERLKPVRKALRIGEFSAYDKTGKKRPGRVPAGQAAGILARSAPARAARAAAAGPPAAIAGHPDLSPEKLSSSDVAKTLRREDVGNIMQHGTTEQKRRLVVQVDVVRKMDEATISSALADVNLRSSVEAALRQINRQDNA